MSFFDLGPSPTKSADVGFNMFGSSNSSSPPSSDQLGSSIFSSAGYGSPRNKDVEGQTTRPAGIPWVAPPTNRPGQPDSQQSSQAHNLPMTSQMAQGQTNPQQAETPHPSVHRQGSYSYNHGPGPATVEIQNTSYSDLKEERKWRLIWKCVFQKKKKSEEDEGILADIVFKEAAAAQ